MSEGQLIARARRGDVSAFEILVGQHAKYVYNLAYRLVSDPQEAEDLSQEAFLRAWRALPGFRRQSSFATWLYRIVTNLCYNRLPNLKKELTALDSDDQALDLSDERQEVESVLLSEERKAFLHRLIDGLPGAYRLVITLRHLQGLSYNEIAAVTGMPLGTVKTAIFRARQVMKDALEAYEMGL